MKSALRIKMSHFSKREKIRLLLTASMIGCCAVAPAYAQSDQNAPARGALADGPKGKDGQLEEIVVTARKQSENLQSVPVAVTAITANILKTRDVRDLAGVDRYAPGLTFQQGAGVNGGSIASSAFIRGIGQRLSQPEADPAVGIYLDGVYLGRIVGSVLSVVDADRIEVLRGPQGTLYGKNTLAGAINIASHLPTGNFGGYFDLGVGSYDERNVRAAIEFPLVSGKLAGRISVASLQHDGYDRDVTTGAKFGDQDTRAARAVLRWTPTDTFRVNLIGDTTRERGNGQASQLTALRPQAEGGNYITANFPALVPVLLDGKRANYGDGPGISDLDSWGVSATVEWDLASNVSLNSITGYRWMKSHVLVDVEGSPIFYDDNDIVNRQNQFSQELRFSGTGWGDRLKWQVGAYYASEKIFDEIGIDRRFCAPGGLFVAATCGAGFIHQIIDGRTTSLAFYSQETLKLLDNLSVTAGIRYSSEKKDYSAFQPGNWGPIRLKPKWNSMTPRISVEYKPSINSLIYVSYSEGFKSGGVNFVNLSPQDFQTPFDPEESKAWEGGLKIDMLDRKLRINTAAFFTKYSNMQFEHFFGDPNVCGTGIFFCSRTLNAGEAELKGVEVELTAKPIPGLDIFGNLAYLHNKVTKVDQSLIDLLASDSTVLNLNTDLPLAPNWTYTVGGSYAFDVGTAGSMALRVDYAYRSKVYFDTNNIEAAAQRSYGLLNVGVAFDSADTRWRVALDAKNLTNRLYSVNGTGATYPSDGYAFVAYGPPRTVTLSVRYRFGE